MKTVLVMFKDGERRDFPVTTEKLIVGRREDCGLRIPTADVSRQHCEIVLKGTELIVRDLGSSNGTYVNGKRVAEAKLLAGDKISIGPIIFIVQVNGLPAKLTPFDAKVEPPKSAEDLRAASGKDATKDLGKGGDKAGGKPGDKKKTPMIDDDDDTEEILDLDDIDLDDMFGDDEDDDDDDDVKPPKKGKK